MSEMTVERDATLEEVKQEVHELRGLLTQLGRETVEATLEAWRARVDNLRVQARLGRMDVQDDVEASIDEAESTLGAVRRRLGALLDEADDVRGALVEGLRSARSDLSSAVEMAEERIEAGRAG
jgi:chromosome segregation ATPase